MGQPWGPTALLLPHSSPTEDSGCPPPLHTQVLQLHALAGDLQCPAVKAGIDKDMERLELDDLALVEVAADTDAVVLQVVLALHHRGPVLVPVPQQVTRAPQDPTCPSPPQDPCPPHIPSRLPWRQSLPHPGIWEEEQARTGTRNAGSSPLRRDPPLDTPAVGVAMGQGHLPVVEGVVGCERLSAPPHAGHVLIVKDNTLHPCKGQTPLGTVVVGSCARAQGCTSETWHMLGSLHIPISLPLCEPNKPSSSQWGCGAACLQCRDPTILFTYAVLVMPGLLAKQLPLPHLCHQFLLLQMSCFTSIPSSAPLSHPMAAVCSPWHCGTGQKPFPANPFCLSHEKIVVFPGFVPDVSILSKFTSLLPFWVLAGVHVSLHLSDGGYDGLCFPLQPLHHRARG